MNNAKDEKLDVEEKLISRDVRPTAMRMLVLRYLIEENNCTSLSALEQHFERADKSTLFRTLSVFEKSGIVHKIDDGTGISKYGLCKELCDCTIAHQHFHFHCTNCTETFCLNFITIPAVELPKGFSISDANLVLKGRCSNCN